MFQQAEFVDRNELGNFLNKKGLKGRAVEVGTHRGDFAFEFLQTWEGKLLTCIDPWENLPEYLAQSKLLWGNGNREEDFQHCQRILEPFQGQVEFLRSTSPKAAQEFHNESLDFVYIDGDHSRMAVLKDLHAWWPKLRKGGILAGHDIVCPGESLEENWGLEIQPSVIEFAEFYKSTIFLIVEMKCLPWSYYFVK